MELDGTECDWNGVMGRWGDGQEVIASTPFVHNRR